MSEEEKLPEIKSSPQPVANKSGEQQLIESGKPKYNSLSIVKKARKQVEHDARLLANRISLLKQEEIKNYKKIDEIKKKAIEIYGLKIENERKIEKKKLQKEKEIKEKQDKIQAKKDQELAEKMNKRELFQMQKILRSQEIKQLKEKNKLKKNYFEKKIKEEKQIRNHLVKQQLISGQQKKQDYYDQKSKYYQELYQLSVNEEETMASKKQNEIKQMEKIENELISKLQQSQAFQKQAFDELEQALLLPPKQFAEKFLAGKEGNNSQLNETVEEAKEKGKERRLRVKVTKGIFENQNNNQQLLICINDEKTQALPNSKEINWFTNILNYIVFKRNSDFILLKMNQNEFEVKLMELKEGELSELGSGKASAQTGEKMKDIMKINSIISNEGKKIGTVNLEVSVAKD